MGDDRRPRVPRPARPSRPAPPSARGEAAGSGARAGTAVDEATRGPARTAGSRAPVAPTAETDDMARAWRRGADRTRRAPGTPRRAGGTATTAANPAGASSPAEAGEDVGRLRGLARAARARLPWLSRPRGGDDEPRDSASARFQARLRERAAQQRRLSAVVWLRRAGYLAAALLAVWVVLYSPVFGLRADRVELEGAGAVVDRAGVDQVVAAHAGTSLALLDTRAMVDELTQVKGVRDVEIARVWPSGLLLAITAREPVAAVPEDGGGYALLDAEAVHVGAAEQAPEDLPVVKVPVGEDHVRVLTAVLGVVNQLPVELRERVQDIRATTEDAVEFQLREGPRVEWGSAEDSALKAQVLGILLQTGDAEDAAPIEVIDVSAPTLPTVKHA
ncbi:cell division protein FtsQ/DivIB [Demequina pelophila]|uniref:cell division protein FtsQ/DivIB n=1 Tax=Demequina pelophila TaxID=1638984 RepID=UPI00078671D7|nr:cell division protein FtsQ/DivIB [Demequina pelophila]